ncbi:unnamed protein product [Amoebophrya sp. A25]|nr:unnamed protein product [Amoebophrya sp. A25]|eukprot:GSA25T00022197001.1
MLSSSTASSRARVLYVYRKSDLRICDNRALEYAVSFGLPISFVAVLDLKGEWDRFGETTRFTSAGPLRRRFHLQCLEDLDKSLKEQVAAAVGGGGCAPGEKAMEKEDQSSSQLYVSEVSLSGVVEKLGSKFDHIVCSRELGTYEEKEEAKAVRAAKSQKTTLHIVADDSMVPLETYPFRLEKDGTNWALSVNGNRKTKVPIKEGTRESMDVDSEDTSKKPPFRDQYTSFRQKVEEGLRKDPMSNTVPGSELVRRYCPRLAASGHVGKRSETCKHHLANVLPRCFIHDKTTSRVAGAGTSITKMRVESLGAVMPPLAPSNDEQKADVASSIARPLFDVLADPPVPAVPHNAPLLDLAKLPEVVVEEGSSGEMKDPSKAITDLEYQGGERAALARLQEYLWTSDAVATYKQTRNGSLGRFFSTKFSMHLAVGAISARTVLHELALYEEERTRNESTYWVFFELLWRDFLHYAIVRHGPSFFYEGGLTGRTRQWSNDVEKFRAWVSGETGFPIVDAWMKELRHTGFMSNRGRQNVASFLVFNLKCDWRWGAEYFEHVLLDHDVASNYGNWLTIAGIGFQTRDNIFNIVKQSKQYEAEGEFMKYWLKNEIGPALAAAPSNEVRRLLLHTPWEVVDSRVRGVMPEYYVRPVVDAKKSFFYDNSAGGDSKGGGKKGKKGKGKNSWVSNGFHDMAHHDSYRPEARAGEGVETKPKRGKWRGGGNKTSAGN